MVAIPEALIVQWKQEEIGLFAAVENPAAGFEGLADTVAAGNGLIALGTLKVR